jgi:Mg-chelatase subunit ChlD
MGSSKQFLIISLIAHLVLFIVLAYVVLPPVDRFKEFLESLSVEFVKLKPVIREENPVRNRVEPEKTGDPEPAQQEPKPPELDSFSLAPGGSTSGQTRLTSSEKVVSIKSQAKKTGMVLSQPSVTSDIILLPTDNKDDAVLPDFLQDTGEIADSSGAMGFSGPQVGPLGSRPGSRGLTDQYVYILSSSGTPSQPRRGADEFSEILPELARGIVKRTSQKKMDVVFLIDTSGSMQDNVRGVKDYISQFLKPLEGEGFDVSLGLVEFADSAAWEAKVFGLTRSQKKFGKWLDKTIFLGGGDIPESGYEALIAALENIDFRDDAQRFFIFISDAPQHDFDYDGMSRYTLDRMIDRLNKEGVTVDVVGANYLPVRQLAWGTGGQWKHIPGGNPLIDVPQPISSMIRSSLARSLPPVPVEDKVTIEFNNGIPDWVDLSYKMLDPLGVKRLGTLTYRIAPKGERKVEFSSKIDFSTFKDQPGTYTLIYRIRDSMDNRDILRRTVELRRY